MASLIASIEISVYSTNLKRANLNAYQLLMSRALLSYTEIHMLPTTRLFKFREGERALTFGKLRN